VGCVPRPAAREEITFVLFVYWEKNGVESRVRLYAPRLGSRSLLLLADSGRCQLGSAAPGGGVGGSVLVRSTAPPILGILPA
jgi:hypothetical protein